MAALSPLLALAAFPVATWIAPNPTRFSWSFRHGSEPMPIEVRNRAESADRYWYFIVDAITIGFVAALMQWDHVSSAQVGLRLSNWKGSVAVGLAAGAIRFLLLYFLVKVVPRISSDAVTDHLNRGSVLLWTAIFSTGAFSEELWIAFCLVVLRTTNHSAVFCAACTAIVFGVVHFEYRLGAIVTAMYGFFSALLFLWLGSLIPMFFFHFIGNMGSLYWKRRRASSAP